MIKIQKENFNIENEVEIIKNMHSNIGAVSTFVGYVRNTNDNKEVKSIDLEVYEEMAEKKISEICKTASIKWSLIDTLVIHRYGRLTISEKIVLVATFAKHRKESFDSCNYIMSFLKQEAPFWKKEFYKKGSKWLQNTT